MILLNLLHSLNLHCLLMTLCYLPNKAKKKELQSIVNQELSKICDWLVANALSSNIKKSNFLYFGKNNKKRIDWNPKVISPWNVRLY